MKQKARQFIKSELAKRDLNYVQLSKIMNKKGFSENPDTIRTKIHRGSICTSASTEIYESSISKFPHTSEYLNLFMFTCEQQELRIPHTSEYLKLFMFTCEHLTV